MLWVLSKFSWTLFILRTEYIAAVQQDTELCSRLSDNVALYMEKVRNAVVRILHLDFAIISYDLQQSSEFFSATTFPAVI